MKEKMSKEGKTGNCMKRRVTENKRKINDRDEIEIERK